MTEDVSPETRHPQPQGSGQALVRKISFLDRVGLANIGIGRKIALGFAAVLVLTVGVSFLGWNGLQNVGAQFEKTDAVALLADKFVDIRNDQKNFQLRGEAGDYATAKEKIKPLRDQAEGLQAAFRSSGDRALIDGLKAEIGRYETELDRYHGLEMQKRAALDRMRLRLTEMEAVTDKLRQEQVRQSKQLTGRLAELEAKREQLLDVSNQAKGLSTMASDILIEMEKFQLTGDAVHANNFQLLTQKLGFNLETLKAMLGEGNADQLPDGIFTSTKSLTTLFTQLANFVSGGKKAEAQEAAKALEKSTQQIKNVLRSVSAVQESGFDLVAGDTRSAKEDMELRQAIAQDANRLIEMVQKTRITQQQYLAKPGSELAADVRYWIGEIKGNAGSLGERLREEDAKAAVQKIAASADGYLGEFDKVVAFTTTQAEADQAMEAASQALNTRIVQTKAGEKAAMTAQRDSSGLLSIIGSAVALVLGVIFAFFISRSITAPLSYITKNMLRLAEGDTSIVLKNRRLQNEIGDLARAMGVFLDKTIEMTRMRTEQEEKDRRAEKEKKAAMAKMADQFETSVGEVVERVSSAATEMQASSEAMSVTAEETTRQSAAVAAASEQASANVQTVASAAEELSSSIAEIGRQVAQASEIAGAAVKDAEQTNAKVQGLAQAANKIGEVVALITAIAEQTNLLALNATIEAARAGDAGKGFAVVASEVKNLANQTAKATEEIGAQISGIQAATREAVAAIESISRTISKINEVNSGVASAVEEQGAATQEIARNVEQAAAGTQEVSSNISGVSQAATETGSAATEIRSAAGELSEQAELLRAEVEKFLASVRTS